MSEIHFISLIKLIQTPEIFNSKEIRVIGFAGIEFEHKAIYVSIEDYDNAITKNAIWIDIELNDKTKSLNKKYVLIEGVFDLTNLGHLKMFSGTITNIERIEEWTNK